MRTRLRPIAFAALTAAPTPLVAQSLTSTTAEPGRGRSACADQPEYRSLDFWVGAWDVYVGDALDGHDKVSQVLAGCAATEAWSDANGGKGSVCSTT